jgi:hypothetical protein
MNARTACIKPNRTLAASLLAAFLLAACGGDSTDPAPDGGGIDVRSAADACISDPGVAEDPVLRTECMVTRLAEACAANPADPVCSEPNAEFQQQLGEAMGEFCLLETDHYTNIIDTVLMCVRNGFAWGCTWLGEDVGALAQCVVDTASVVCAAPMIGELPLCRDGQLVGLPGPDGEPGLFATLLGIVVLPCREGPEEGAEMCEETALDALCRIPLAHSLNLCWSTLNSGAAGIPMPRS